MKIVLEVEKPRNPYVALAHKRKSGSHSKPEKANRRQEKVILRGLNIKLMCQILTLENTGKYREALPTIYRYA